MITHNLEVLGDTQIGYSKGILEEVHVEGESGILDLQVEGKGSGDFRIGDFLWMVWMDDQGTQGYIGGIRWAGLSINGIISENLPCHVLIIFGGHLSNNIRPGLFDYLLME